VRRAENGISDMSVWNAEVRQAQIKKRNTGMRKSFVVATLGLFVTGAAAEPLKIIGFETGSGIIFEGATVSNYYTLEFATTVSGPWTNWGSVCSQAITGTVMALPSPFFYRIKQTEGSAFPPYAPATNIPGSMLADGGVDAAKLAPHSVDLGGVTVTGTVPDTRLSPNVALLNANQTFSGQNAFNTAVVDPFANNNGTVGSGLLFGSLASGEGIGSKRTTGGNQYGLDFYTCSAPQVSITSNGNVGIGTTSPTAKLEVVGKVKADNILQWKTVAGATQQAETNAGYLCVSLSQVVVTLPPAPAVGDIVRVTGGGSLGWKISQNSGQTILAGNLTTGDIEWTPHETNRAWQGVASSADGVRLVAVAENGPIVTSSDSGLTWVPRDTNRNWRAVASSASGARLVAVVWGGQIYTSDDFGATWTAEDQDRNWFAVASSASGARLVALGEKDIYTRPDLGEKWIKRVTYRTLAGDPFPSGGVASSADGSKLYMVSGAVNGEPTEGSYFSSNAGAAWKHVTGFWGGSVACSADGTRLIARGGEVQTSIDSGAHWTSRSITGEIPVAISADGIRLVAEGGHSISSDSGLTWTAHGSNRVWRAVACSADGTKLVAAERDGQIYTLALRTTPGTSGYLVGGQGSAIELQYIGNNQFLPISYVGAIFAY
jgi:hypothetical protein